MHKQIRIVLSLVSVPLSMSVALAQPPAGKGPADKAAPAADKAPAGAPAGGPAAAMTPPKPAPEFETFMKAGEGNWKCETTMPAGAMGPGSPEMKNKSNIKIKKALNGFGYEGSWESKKTKEMPAMKGQFVMAYDAADKQLISTSFDSMGGLSQTAGTISGESATLTGNGSMMGKKMKVRQTINTTAGGKQMTHTFDVDMGQGWQTMSKDECKK